MNRIFIMVTVLVLAGCAHDPPAASATALDQLLAFSSAAECEPSVEHAALLRAMWTGGADKDFRVGKVNAPAHLANAFGRIRIAKEDAHTTVSVTTSGTLFGLPLAEIIQTFPEGGDPGDVTYRFAAPAKAVEIAANARGLPARSGRKVPVGSAGAYEQSIHLLPAPGPSGHSLLTCTIG